MRIILRRAGAMGDLLQTTPVVRRLRLENPEAWIGVETTHHQIYRDNPDINEIGRFTEYDRLIDLDRPEVYDMAARMPEVDAYMLAAFGDTGEGHDKSIVFRWSGVVTPWEEGAIIVHPAVSWPSRTIDKTFWNRLATRLLKYRQVVVTGTGIDHQLLGLSDTRCMGMSLAEQVGVIANAACFVGGDGGLTVAACATDTPVVSFCTISKPEFFAPIRHGEKLWNFTPIRAGMPCFGCREDAGPITRLECRFGTNACVRYFDVDAAVGVVIAAISADRRHSMVRL